MKINRLKPCLILMLLLFVMSGFTVNAKQKADVTFDNTSQIVTKGDLFDQFKGVMPGDKLVDSVTIKNDCSEYDYIRVYMRAEANAIENIESIDSPTQDDVNSMNAFLSQLDIEVLEGTLTENVLLGELKKNETISFDVHLNVPIEMGNEYATRIGEVDWIFTIEGYDNPENQAIQTGDNSNIGWYVIMVIIALAGIGYILYRRK